MTLLARLKQTLRTQRESANPLVRHGVGAIFSARDLAAAAKSFATDDKYRSTVLLRWFKSGSLHQTTVLTWMDRYPAIFAACRDLFADTPGIRILSFGCSSGEEVLTLREYFKDATIVGAEINPRNLVLCRQHKVDDRIAFVRSDPATIMERGPYDLIFCMAVLQRTPHAVEAQQLKSLKEIYPFLKFDRQITELDSFLKPGGVLVVHHTQYFFTDASVAAAYAAVDGDAPPVNDGPRFDRNSALIENAMSRGSIFRKRAR